MSKFLSIDFFFQIKHNKISRQILIIKEKEFVFINQYQYKFRNSIQFFSSTFNHLNKQQNLQKNIFLFYINNNYLFLLLLLFPMHSSVYLDSQKKTVTQASTNPENESIDNYLRKRSEYYFFKMASRQMTDEQMRVEFSKDILTMFLTSVPSNIISQSHIQQMEVHLQQNMTFLKTLYPEPKMSIINRQVFDGLKQFDHTDRIQFDLLANLGFSYQTKNKDSSRTDILSQTQTFLNNLIKSSQQTLNQFTHLLMTEIPKKIPSSSRAQYQNLMKQPWKFDLESDIAKTYVYNKELVSQKLYFPSIQLFRIASQWTQHLQQIIDNPEKYLNQTENMKMLNGRVGNARLRNQKNQARIFNKFPSHGQNFISSADSQNPEATDKQKIETKKQIQSQSFFSRVYKQIRQFCQGESQASTDMSKIDYQYQYETFSQSTAKINYAEPTIQNVEKWGNYRFKQSGYLLNHYLESLQQINSQVGYKKFCEQQLQFLRKGYIQTIRVVDKNKIKQKYTIEEKKVYSFCQNAYYFMEEVVLERLIKLIQTFLRLKQKSQNQYQKSMVFQDVELVKFNEKNVISAFIMADEKLLIDIYKALIQLTQTRQAKIAKIQNRFGTSFNDALIVIKIKNNPILCQLRLMLEPQNFGPESKQKALGQMHKFLTDIESSQYGPISYLALILATKDFRVSYLQSIRKVPLNKNLKLAQVCHCGKGNVSEKSSVNTFEKQIRNIISPEGHINLDCYRNLIPTSFVCGVCQKVVKKGQCVIPVPSCSECGFHICVECSFENNNEIQRGIYAMLINSVAKIVDPCYFSELELADYSKMNYNHSYTKDVQVISNNRAQIRKEIYYHIILQGSNFARYGKLSTPEQFWNQVRQKIDLRSIPQYKNAIKQQKFAGILFTPRQLLHEKGTPFMYLIYDGQSNTFSKLVYKGGQDIASQVPVDLNEITVNENDVFIPILWIFGETLVTEYITKVLQTNPFCVKKISLSDSSVDYMRFSRSRIRSHHIMK